MNTGTDWISGLQFDERGLIPAVIQDVRTKNVLMLAYMNQESLHKTIETGQTWFWSRSRQELWNKGATSGHVQQVQSIAYDCDADTLLLEVEQTGAACHTGEPSCFYTKVPYQPQRESAGVAGKLAQEGTVSFEVLADLIATINQRYADRPEGAYTTYLFERGLDKILKKVGEESSEVIIGAKNGDRKELVSETGDLLYHLLVLLRQQSVPFQEVLAELEQRHGVQDIRNKQR